VTASRIYIIAALLFLSFLFFLVGARNKGVLGEGGHIPTEPSRLAEHRKTRSDARLWVRASTVLCVSSALVAAVLVFLGRKTSCRRDFVILAAGVIICTLFASVLVWECRDELIANQVAPGNAAQ